MVVKKSRRELILVSGVVLSGCLENGSETNNRNEEQNTNTDESGETKESIESNVPDRCNLSSRKEQGNAESITVTANLDGKSLEEACASKAAEAAATRMADELTLELKEPWIQVGAFRSDGYSPRIGVIAEISSGGDPMTCPDPAYDFDEAISVLPSEVTVLHRDGETEDSCTYEIELTQETRYFD